MGSTNYLGKSKTGYRAKSGSSGGSDREMNGKFRRTKIKRPSKMGEYGLKRIPDYTEMAYKEAVSKLKYFLTGNSVPSVRSYGSYTGKTDEADDLDKKYSNYNTLAEYKPKPRLTAKYTTLYADSLNNYTPQQTNVPASTGADPSGGTNQDVVNFIQKQEEYIEQLERESQYCRDELNNLLGKVKEVISENEHLHEAQKNKIISRMFHSYNEGSETDDLDDIGDSTGLDSDNKVTPLKSRKNKRPTKLEGPNIVFESRIAELEAQLAQSKIDLKKVQDENNENKRKLATGLVDSTCLDGFKRQIDNLQRDKSMLESQISKLKLSLENKDGDWDSRHKKSSDIIEQQLREERNNLEAELRRLKEELSTERNKVRELTGAGARRVLQERSAAELRHNAHTEQLARDLAAQYELAAKLQLDLDRQRRDENDLKREISMKNAAIEELKIELKNKSANLQADLAQANAEKASLEEELASARLALERHQRQARHDTNRLNSEIQSLRQRLDRADADLVHSRRENLRLSEQISTLEKELNMKNLTPLSHENKKEKELSSMLENMENKHAKTVAELESMIQSQNSLMEKLTGECRLLTDKLDDANRRHKEELAALQRQIRNLGQSLQKPRTQQPSTYKAPSSHVSATDRTSNPSPSTRPDYSGSEPPRNTTLRENNRLDRDNVDNHYETQPHIDNTQNNDTNYVAIAQETYNSEGDSNNILESDKTKKTKAEEKGTVKQLPSQEAENKDLKYNEYETSNDQDNSHQQQVGNETTVNIDRKRGYLENQESNENEEYTEQTQPTDQFVGQNYNENYNQNFEQPQYTEQYENYEQYQQGYTDPNAQYESQYENYETDDNYTEQNDDVKYNQEYSSNVVQEETHDNTQYNQEYNSNVAQEEIHVNSQYNPEYNSNVAPEEINDNSQYNQEYNSNVAQEEIHDNSQYNPEYNSNVAPEEIKDNSQYNQEYNSNVAQGEIHDNTQYNQELNPNVQEENYDNIHHQEYKEHSESTPEDKIENSTTKDNRVKES